MEGAVPLPFLALSLQADPSRYLKAGISFAPSSPPQKKN